MGMQQNFVTRLGHIQVQTQFSWCPYLSSSTTNLNYPHHICMVARVMARYSRVVFRAMLWVGFCCFFLVGVSTSTRVPISTTASVGVSMSKEGATRTHDGSVLNYVSKRRVPNGPDPIHNRRIKNTRRSPERA